MGLAEKFRGIWDEPADRDLLDFLGVKPGTRFQIGHGTVTVGEETVSLAEVRQVMNEGSSLPSGRKVKIEDL